MKKILLTILILKAYTINCVQVVNSLKDTCYLSLIFSGSVKDKLTSFATKPIIIPSKEILDLPMNYLQYTTQQVKKMFGLNDCDFDYLVVSKNESLIEKFRQICDHSMKGYILFDDQVIKISNELIFVPQITHENNVEECNNFYKNGIFVIEEADNQIYLQKYVKDKSKYYWLDVKNFCEMSEWLINAFPDIEVNWEGFN